MQVSFTRVLHDRVLQSTRIQNVSGRPTQWPIAGDNIEQPSSRKVGSSILSRGVKNPQVVVTSLVLIPSDEGRDRQDMHQKQNKFFYSG